MQLWQTRLLRFSKLDVADEIENVLAFYKSTFLQEIPILYKNLEKKLGNQSVASFLGWEIGLVVTGMVILM